MPKEIFLSAPHMSGHEQRYIAEVFKSNYIAPTGTMLTRFETMIKEQTKVPYALAVVNGTSAIHLALRILGIKEGDEVLASTFTFIGSVAPILYQGAKPVFIDSDESWNLSPKLLKEYLQQCAKKPKALIVTHLYGMSAAIEEIAHICKEYGVYLIEDAAESLGATFKKRHTGSFGDFGIYSFNGNKILTTSSGGMLVTFNEQWHEKALFYATQAKEDAPFYEHKEFGYNYRMSNVLAAIGVAQMEVLDERVQACRNIFLWYKEALEEFEKSGALTFMPELPNSRGNRWLTTLVFHSIVPQKLMAYLKTHHIESRPLWKPMHLQPLFKESKALVNGTSERLFHQGLCLPSGSDLSKDEIFYIAGLIKTFLLEARAEM